MSLENKKKNQIVPEPALRRMPCYLSYLKLAQKDGMKHISSTFIARDMGVDPTQVTKDLSYVITSYSIHYTKLYDCEKLNLKDKSFS